MGGIPSPRPSSPQEQIPSYRYIIRLPAFPIQVYGNALSSTSAASVTRTVAAQSPNTKDREKGKYYRRMWEAAIQHEADMVSITSYNEWGEGTQIEPAVRKTGYEDPGDDPNFYLQLTNTRD